MLYVLHGAQHVTCVDGCRLGWVSVGRVVSEKRTLSPSRYFASLLSPLRLVPNRIGYWIIPAVDMNFINEYNRHLGTCLSAA